MKTTEIHCFSFAIPRTLCCCQNGNWRRLLGGNSYWGWCIWWTGYGHLEGVSAFYCKKVWGDYMNNCGFQDLYWHQNSLTFPQQMVLIQIKDLDDGKTIMIAPVVRNVAIFYSNFTVESLEGLILESFQMSHMNYFKIKQNLIWFYSGQIDETICWICSS